MPAILCKCGNKLNYGEIPNPIEYLVISDKDYDQYEGVIDSEVLYQNMTSALRCPSCGRISVFWDGFDSVPTFYCPEK